MSQPRPGALGDVDVALCVVHGIGLAVQPGFDFFVVDVRMQQAAFVVLAGIVHGAEHVKVAAPAAVDFHLYVSPNGERRLWFDDNEIEEIMVGELERSGMMPSATAPVVDLEAYLAPPPSRQTRSVL